MAGLLQWFPDTLYNSAIRTIVANYHCFQNDLKTFPENVVFDVCYKLYKENRLCQLGFEFCQLDLFARILKVKDKRYLLHHCVQALMDHGAHTTKLLSVAFKRNCFHMAHLSSEKTIKFGLSLAEFLAEAGWFEDSEEVALSALNVCKTRNDIEHLKLSLECNIKLLYARTQFCKFPEAIKTFKDTIDVVEKLKTFNVPINYSCVYGAFMNLYFSRSEYAEAYKWSLRALKELTSNIPANLILDILRQAARACVVKREFKRADLLIKQALSIAKENFGDKHPKTADTMLDYGFYLLNVDSVAQSVKVYQTALDIRQTAFGGHNLLVAIAHEDLAYALYVQEYSTGKFEDAREHAEKALQIMNHLLPPDHLLLASSKRVKALVLEEIAIDNQDKTAEHQLLMEAQELHLAALKMTRLAFGEMNVQTAKHYGNLGRLYQSMRRYREAEQMHLKAIEIKEEILGPEDYEVALSVGHLASLYNYDMKIFDKAEHLYLKSINIGLKLFGAGYSGLEYDYRGLLRIFISVGNHEKYMEYNNILRDWKTTRDLNSQDEVEATPMPPNTKLIPPERILREFLSIQ